jgi:hypothetical protein
MHCRAATSTGDRRPAPPIWLSIIARSYRPSSTPISALTARARIWRRW